MKSQKERLKEALGNIASNCAYIKFSGEEVDYIRIDDVIFDNPKTMADDVIAYAEKIRKAETLALQYKNIEDIGKHIDPYIKKYHPIWIYTREQAGFTTPNEGEENCYNEYIIKTYEQWMNFFVTAGGMQPIFNPNVKKDAPMNYKVFESTFNFENEETKKFDEDPSKFAHEDFLTFDRVSYLKEKTDLYQEEISKGVKTKNLTYNMKDVSFSLDEEKFPLVSIGKHNKKITYDLRNTEDAILCYCRLADKNPDKEEFTQYREYLAGARYYKKR
ncbi:MAG: hypothetical protein IJ093_03060 [Bacilli bacterium]|nr:hypothetical protein [Bacilli bacterium]